MLTSLTALLLLEPTDVFAAAPRPEDWVEGTGLVELILLCIAVFLLLVPFSVVRGLLRRRSLRDSLWEAWHFAIYGAFGIIGVGAGLVVLVGIPFGILNMVGLQ